MTVPAYEPISDDDLYRHSSQFRIWSLTPEELESKRRAVYERACRNVPGAIAKDKNVPETSIEVLSYEEEQQLIQYYSTKLLLLGDGLQQPTQVSATALSYFRKFYTVHSTMEHHPKDIFSTCIFLAAKVENNLIKIDYLCKVLRKNQKEILDCEFLVLQSLSFTLLVHNGYRPMRGLLLDIQAVIPHLAPPEALEPLRLKTKKAIIDSFFSDVQFHFTPPQIALAALMTADETLTMEYLKKKFGHDGIELLRKDNPVIDTKGVSDLQMLLEIIEECRKMIQSVPQVPDQMGKATDRKLYYLYNPDKQAKRKLARAEAPEVSPAPSAPSAPTAPASTGSPEPKRQKMDD
ncbi:uncharacterized protein SAPINGB_P004116 [Magnusiomyces paraingens]|uniref:Cyclin-like domain-containing protein n=1 Tax=Magnusiomyces paraingens TaxID=2606893 RepID=A0A5E8BV20_9ASCO|nr:uncharacterized protein SAPINGB_P004116 [Saprochaete ingens]VVT54519.1 unnamed protein product [Saprochaete ingens]